MRWQPHYESKGKRPTPHTSHSGHRPQGLVLERLRRLVRLMLGLCIQDSGEVLALLLSNLCSHKHQKVVASMQLQAVTAARHTHTTWQLHDNYRDSRIGCWTCTNVLDHEIRQAPAQPHAPLVASPQYTNGQHAHLCQRWQWVLCICTAVAQRIDVVNRLEPCRDMRLMLLGGVNECCLRLLVLLS